MRATIHAIQLCTLILLITACQPQADQNIIEATTQAPASTESAISEVDAQDTAVPSVQPTLGSTPTFFSLPPSARGTAVPGTNLPPVLGEPTETPLFTLTPTRIADPDMKFVEDVAAYLAAICGGNLNAREPHPESRLWLRRLSPDGQLMLFSVPVEDKETFALIETLWLMNIDGSNLRFLLSEERIWSLKWIPGTHQFVYNTGGLRGKLQ